MTRKEVTEIFSIIMVAWPNSKIFSDEQKLKPAVETWAACTKDIDFWTAKKTIISLCQNNKYPPSINEFRERAAEINAKLAEDAKTLLDMIRIGFNLYGNEALDKIPAAHRVIAGMEEPLLTDDRWNVDGFVQSYTDLRKAGQLKGVRPAEQRKELPS